MQVQVQIIIVYYETCVYTSILNNHLIILIIQASLKQYNIYIYIYIYNTILDKASSKQHGKQNNKKLHRW